MLTVDDFQRDLSNPALVQSFVTNARTVEVDTGLRKDGKPITVFVVLDQPGTLVRQAGLAPEEADVYALARLLKSEGYSGPIEQKARALIAIGQSVINRARAKYGNTPFAITRLLTTSVFKVANGLFGEQAGRYAATSQDPRPFHVKLARALLNGELPDIVKGAQYFLDPWGPGAMQRGKPLQPFDRVLKKWHDVYKYARVAVDGLSPMALLLFKPESDPVVRERSLAEAVKQWRIAFAGGGSRDSEGRLGGTTDDEEVSFNPVRMLRELLDTVHFIDTLSTQWPKGAEKYPIQPTLHFLNTLLSMEIAIVNNIITSKDRDIRQQIVNEEQWNRIINELQRATDPIIPVIVQLTKAFKAGEREAIMVPTDKMRDDAIKLAIAIKSALMVIPELEKNVPGMFFTVMIGLFTVTGMGMTAFLRQSFELMKEGVLAFLHLAGKVLKPVTDALSLILKIGLGVAGGLVGWKIYSDVKRQREEDR